MTPIDSIRPFRARFHRGRQFEADVVAVIAVEHFFGGTPTVTVLER